MDNQKIVGSEILPKIKAKVDAKVDQSTFDSTIGDITAILESI